MKIISLLPSATEIVYALGLENRLEGVTFECDYPAEASSKPILSTSVLDLGPDTDQGEIDRQVSERMAAGEPLYRIDEQQIRRIEPDLILAQDLCRVCAVPSGQVTDALDKLGCNAEVLSLDPMTLDDVIDGIDEVARAAGVTAEGAAVSGGLRSRLERVRERTRALEPVGVLALEWADPPFIGGHWLPGMVEAAGGRDVLGTEEAASRRTTWDEIEEAAPEVVVYMPCGFGLDDAIRQCRDLWDDEKFASLPAARAGRVYAVDASAYFSRPGPRVVDGVEIMAWCVAPELFDEPPAGVSSVVR